VNNANATPRHWLKHDQRNATDTKQDRSSQTSFHPKAPHAEITMNAPINTPSDSASEDPFFVLRDSRMLFQRRLTEIARLAGVTSPPVIEAFTEALGTAHDELAASNQRDGFEQTHGLTSSRITLMGDDDLELEIRIGDIARKLVDIGGNALWKAHLRYMTLLRRPEMAPEDNPIGPETICQGLWAICHTSGAGLEGNFALLDRIEELLGLQLSDLYSALNDLLASRNVEPAQTKLVSTGGVRTPGAPQSTVNAEGNANPLSALQSMLNQQLGGAASGAFGLTPGSGGGSASGGNVALNAATLVMLNQLAARLDQLELFGPAQGPSASAPNGDEARPLRTLRAKDLDLPLGNSEAIALDTMAHIFEAIFDIWELPDTVKTSIGRLQIPLLKLAIFDPSLFSDTAHPAHRLINGMARASIGLPRNVSRAHPVSSRLWQLASTVAETLQGDASVLTAPLAELDALIAERDLAVQTAAQPYMLLLREKEAREKAALAARRWLQSIEEQSIAPEILDFLRRYWLHVMEVSSGEDNENNSRWQENHNTIVDLLWSVQSKANVDDRKRLASLLPSLLKRISAGLDRIGTPAAERAPFMDACFTLQTAALRGNPAPPAAPAVRLPQTDVTPGAGVVTDILEEDGMLLKILSTPGQAPSSYRNPGSIVKTGSWLQFKVDDNEPLCGMVCWLNPHSGSALLFNPDWGYAVALAPAVLEQQLRDARAKVVSSLAIFDLAAERALSQLARA
jgi:hypothetical protein